MNNEAVISPEPFGFQPPTGGDVGLKSNDGVVFMVHSSILGLASTVFSGMFSTANRADTVELSDDAESISLMLRFIYPPAFLDDLSLPLLKKSLYMAQKYSIDGIPPTIDYIISHSSNDNSPLKLDPASIFELAITFQLKATQVAAARSIRPPWTVEEVAQLAKTLPNHSSIIGLLGAQLARTKALLDICGDIGLVVPEHSNGSVNRSELVMCKSCIDKWRQQLSSGAWYFPPWMESWGILAIPDLILKPLPECDTLFSPAVLDVLRQDENVCLDCIDAAKKAGNGEVFRNWSRLMKEHVEFIFASAESLYNL